MHAFAEPKILVGTRPFMHKPIFSFFSIRPSLQIEVRVWDLQLGVFWAYLLLGVREPLRRRPHRCRVPLMAVRRLNCPQVGKMAPTLSRDSLPFQSPISAENQNSINIGFDILRFFTRCTSCECMLFVWTINRSRSWLINMVASKVCIDVPKTSWETQSIWSFYNRWISAIFVVSGIHPKTRWNRRGIAVSPASSSAPAFSDECLTRYH